MMQLYKPNNSRLLVNGIRRNEIPAIIIEVHDTFSRPNKYVRFDRIYQSIIIADLEQLYRTNCRIRDIKLFYKQRKICNEVYLEYKTKALRLMHFVE